jgi:hypothetical protein
MFSIISVHYYYHHNIIVANMMVVFSRFYTRIDKIKLLKALVYLVGQTYSFLDDYKKKKKKYF